MYLSRLTGIIAGLNSVAESHTVLLPLHPRTRRLLGESQSHVSDRIKILEPFGYTDMLRAEATASVVVTDSEACRRRRSGSALRV